MQQPGRRGQAADGARERRRRRAGRGRRSRRGRRCRSRGRAGAPARRSTATSANAPRSVATSARAAGQRRSVGAVDQVDAAGAQHPRRPAATISRVRTWSGRGVAGEHVPDDDVRATRRAASPARPARRRRGSAARGSAAGRTSRARAPAGGVELDRQLPRPGPRRRRPRARARSRRRRGARRRAVRRRRRPGRSPRPSAACTRTPRRGGVGEVEVGAGHAVDQDRHAVGVVGVADQLDGARGDRQRVRSGQSARAAAACGWSVRGWAASGGAVAGGHGAHATALRRWA